MNKAVEERLAGEGSARECQGGQDTEGQAGGCCPERHDQGEADGRPFFRAEAHAGGLRIVKPASVKKASASGLARYARNGAAAEWLLSVVIAAG